MKLRTGFVSNSSSSSFVIICKGELTEEKLRKALSDVAKSFQYSERAFYNSILDNVEEQENISFECGWHSLEAPLSSIAAEGIRVYTGAHEDNTGSDVSAELCRTNLTAQTNELKIIWKPR